MEIIRNQKITVKKEYDVVVVGGGVAGIAAALAAKRNGSSVLLLEKGCFLGGLATAGLVNLFVPLCNGRGIQIVKGMAEDFLRTSVKYGYDSLNCDWMNGEPDHPSTLRYATFFSPHIFAMQMLELLKNENIDLLFNAVFEDSVMENNICKGVIVLCEEGLLFFPAKSVVDASGSALVFQRAGAETNLGHNYFSYFGYALSLESCAKAVEKQNIRYALQWRQGGTANLYGERHPQGMEFFYGDTSENITRYLSENQLCLLEKLKSEERDVREISTLPSMPQLRTVRCICGEYSLSEKDLYQHFDDSVTAVCDSERRDSLYEIPFRSMYDRHFPNLIAAGRNIAATGYLWDVVRVIPPAIVTGQAAGTAAALAVNKKTPFSDLSVPELQNNLAEQNVMIHFQDEWIPADRKAGEYSPASHSHPDRKN